MPKAGVVGQGGLQEGHGARGALVGRHPAEGHARVVVDRHEEELPAGAGDTVATVAAHPRTHALDAAEFLDADGQEVARRGVLVTRDRSRRFEVAPFGQPRPRQDPAHGTLGEAQGGGDGAWVSLRRRSSTIARAWAGGIARGLVRGRELASASAVGPPARWRASHLRAVVSLTPAAVAAAAGESFDSIIVRTISPRRANVSPGFLWWFVRPVSWELAGW